MLCANRTCTASSTGVIANTANRSTSTAAHTVTRTDEEVHADVAARLANNMSLTSECSSVTSEQSPVKSEYHLPTYDCNWTSTRPRGHSMSHMSDHEVGCDSKPQSDCACDNSSPRSLYEYALVEKDCLATPHSKSTILEECCSWQPGALGWAQLLIWYVGVYVAYVKLNERARVTVNGDKYERLIVVVVPVTRSARAQTSKGSWTFYRARGKHCAHGHSTSALVFVWMGGITGPPASRNMLCGSQLDNNAGLLQYEQQIYCRDLWSVRIETQDLRTACCLAARVLYRCSQWCKTPIDVQVVCGRSIGRALRFNMSKSFAI